MKHLTHKHRLPQAYSRLVIAALMSVIGLQAQVSLAADPLDAVCMITYRSVSRGAVVCTGTLISNQSVVTSGQCFQGREDIDGVIAVGCGAAQTQYNYRASKALQHKEVFSAIGVYPYRDGNVNSGQDSGRDFAMLRLDHGAMQVSPMETPFRFDSFKNEFLTTNPALPNTYELKMGVECRTSWFEVDTNKKQVALTTLDYSPGNDMRASVSQDLQTNASITVQTWGRKLPPSQWNTRTGAALYCRKDASYSWKLIGISSSYYTRGSNDLGMEFLASTFSPHFLGMSRNNQMAESR